MLKAGDLQSLLPFRWPRLMAACAAGGLLAMAGALLQRLTGNPMASPEVIGVSGGAGLGFAAAITLFPAAGLFELFCGAGLGSAAVMMLVLFFSVRRHLAPEKYCSPALPSVRSARRYFRHCLPLVISGLANSLGSAARVRRRHQVRRSFLRCFPSCSRPLPCR